MTCSTALARFYARGLIRKGVSAFSILGVNAQEPQSAIDALINFGCFGRSLRERPDLEASPVEGLNSFFLKGTSAVVRAAACPLAEPLLEIMKQTRARPHGYPPRLIRLRQHRHRLVRCPDHAAVSRERFGTR